MIHDRLALNSNNIVIIKTINATILLFYGGDFMTIYLCVEIFKGRGRCDQHNGRYSHDAAARAAAAGGPHGRLVTTITLDV